MTGRMPCVRVVLAAILGISGAVSLTVADETRPASAEAIGVVLGAGGAFGAWQVGALQAFHDHWEESHGAPPPIKAIVGTSTGALIAPFLFRGREGIDEAAKWYARVKETDLFAPRFNAAMPVPLFALTADSFFQAGYRGGQGRALLYGKIVENLDATRLANLRAAWPRRRLGAATVDFVQGHPILISNHPARAAVLREGIYASAMAPLALQGVAMSLDDHDGRQRMRLYDGGTVASVPVRELFELVGYSPPIRLTHVVVVTAMPVFPATERGRIQQGDFPDQPDFRAVNERAIQLLSEASAAKDVALLKSAVRLRELGVSQQEVENLTGLRIPAGLQLTILRPAERLGWRSLEFNRDDMRAFLERGYREAREQLGNAGHVPSHREAR